MRELLEQKDTQLQALQQDHEALKEKYEQLLSSTASGMNAAGSHNETYPETSTSKRRNMSHDEG